MNREELNKARLNLDGTHIGSEFEDRNIVNAIYALVIELRYMNDTLTTGGVLDGNTEKVNETRETD